MRAAALIFVLPFSLVLGVSAFAADLPVLPKPKPERAAPVQPDEFDKLGSDCIEATNTCQRFTRASDGKFDALNNIGIACQPQPLRCTVRR